MNLIYAPYFKSIIINKKNKKNNSSIVFKNNTQFFFSYIIIENYYYTKKKNKNISSIYYIYAYWSTLLYSNNSHISHLDSIIAYFTSLFIFKIKFNIVNEAPSFFFFFIFNFFYKINFIKIKNVISISKEDRFFYTQKTNNFFKSEFFDIIQENNFLIFNKIYKFNFSSLSKKKKKYKKTNKIFSKFIHKKLVSKFFSNIIKKVSYISINYKTKIKFKRLFKLSKKNKKNQNRKISLPYNLQFLQKRKIKKIKSKFFNRK